MVANQEALGPSVGPIPARVFDAQPATLEKDLDRHHRSTARARHGVRAAARRDQDRAPRGLPARHARRRRRLGRGGLPRKGNPAERARRGRGVDRRPGAHAPEHPPPDSHAARDQPARRAGPAREDSSRPSARRRRRSRHAVRLRSTRALYGGITAETWLQPGIKRADVADHQASFYKKRDPEGRVSLILGAGNVSSIPPMDIVYKMFVDGSVVLLKMNPVNEYLGPAARAGASGRSSSEGTSRSSTAARRSARISATTRASATCTSPARTRRTISSCGARPDRSARTASAATTRSSRSRSRASSGTSSPVIVVPGPYTDAELSSMAENAAGHGHEQRVVQLQRGEDARPAEGLGAARRLHQEADRRARDRPAAQGVLPGRRAALRGADRRPCRRAKDRQPPASTPCPGRSCSVSTPQTRSEQNFTTEPFCSILSEVSIGERRRSGRVSPRGHGLRERPRLGHAERDALRPPEGRGVGEREGGARRLAARSPLRNGRHQRLARARVRAR